MVSLQDPANLAVSHCFFPVAGWHVARPAASQRTVKSDVCNVYSDQSDGVLCYYMCMCDMLYYSMYSYSHVVCYVSTFMRFVKRHVSTHTHVVCNIITCTHVVLRYYMYSCGVLLLHVFI